VPAGDLSYFVRNGHIITGHMSRDNPSRLVDIRPTTFKLIGPFDKLQVEIVPENRSWWEQSALGVLQREALDIRTETRNVQQWFLGGYRTVTKTFLVRFSIRFEGEKVRFKCDIQIDYIH